MPVILSRQQRTSKWKQLHCASPNWCNACVRALAKMATSLIWDKMPTTRCGSNIYTCLYIFTVIHIEFCRAVTLAETLLSKVRSDQSIPPKTRTWVCDTFDPSELIRSVMAFHLVFFVASWLASSCMENIFNIWKKFNKARISRSLLCETLTTLLDLVERRLNADAIMLKTKSNDFIDMRIITNEGKLANENSAQRAKRRHKKKLSTFQLFSKERDKLQDPSLCTWSGAIKVPEKDMWLLKVSVHGLYVIAFSVHGLRFFMLCLEHAFSVHGLRFFMLCCEHAFSVHGLRFFMLCTYVCVP